jgi:hypothetical protein
MQFAVHLNVIKMIGNPVDHLRIEADRQDVVAQKADPRGTAEDVRRLFTPDPKSVSNPS